MLERLPHARLAFVGTGPAEEELKEYYAGTNTVFTGILRGTQTMPRVDSNSRRCLPRSFVPLMLAPSSWLVLTAVAY